MIAKLLSIRIFDIEASSVCNLSCQFCPRELLPETGLMREKTFICFLKNVPLRATDELAFVGLGEPLLNPCLPDFLVEAKKYYPKVRTWVTTNGTLLSPEILLRLLEAKLDVLDISFNGIDAETYEQLMKGASFEHTLANIKYALDEIHRRGGQTKLQVNYIIAKENIAQKDKIRAFWRMRGIKYFREQRMHSRGNIKVERMTPMDTPGRLHSHSCVIFKAMPFISWQGDVFYCSHDIYRQHKIGNICQDRWEVIEERKKKIIRQNKWLEVCRTCDDPFRHDLWKYLDKEIIFEIAGKAIKSLKVFGR